MRLIVEEDVLTKYWAEECDEGIVRIPKGIRVIGEGAFAACATIKEVILPDGLTEIGDAAFSNCIRLEKIHLPDSLRRIGEYAFFMCRALGAIRLPEQMTHIGKGAFKFCSELRELYLPEGLTTLENEICAMCEKLELLSLPASVQEAAEVSQRSSAVLFGSSPKTIIMRGGWYKGLMRSLNIATFMTLKDLYVQRIEEVHPQYVSIALSTFMRHEKDYAEDVRRGYYEYIRTHASVICEISGLSAELLELLCREKLILRKDAQWYFDSMSDSPEHLVRLTEHLRRERLLDRQALDFCLETAVDNHYTEVTAMLLGYAHEMRSSDELTL